MPAERYFIENLPIEANSQVILEGQEFHHFLHVMRNVPGNEIELVDGQGKLAEAKVEAIEKKHASLKILTITESPAPSYAIILAQAIPKFNRLEFILEKGTELGMTEIWLFPSARSEKKSFSANQLERMDAIIISAMKQCGRLYRPSILIRPPLVQWPKPTLECFYGDIEPTASSFFTRWQSAKPSQGVVFFIGPEGGFSTEEVQTLQTLGATGVKLHQNILRTDTAALSALSLISAKMA